MQIPIPTELTPGTQPPPTSITAIGTDVTESFVAQGRNRFPTGGSWVPEATFVTFDEALLVDVACNSGDITDDVADAVTDPNIPAPTSAAPFMYARAAICSDIGVNERERTGQRLRRAMERTWPLALSYRLGQLINEHGVGVEGNAVDGTFTATTLLAPGDAVAALDEALLAMGIYDGVITVPATYISRLTQVIRREENGTLRTVLGTEVHISTNEAASLAPAAPAAGQIANAGGVPLFWGCGRINYAQDEIQVFDGPQDGAAYAWGDADGVPDPGVDARITKNRHRVFAYRYGELLVDPGSMVVAQPTAL